MARNGSSQSEPVNKGRRVMIFIAFAVLIIALAVCLVLLLTKKDSGQAQIQEKNEAQKALERGFVSEDSVTDIMSEMDDKVAEGMFECKMTTTWTFEDSSSESPNAYVANVENNLHTLYFDVRDSSTDEVLYSSPMLPVGTEINNIKLEKELPAGDYQAVVMYTLVDENYEEVSTVGFNITISILH